MSNQLEHTSCGFSTTAADGLFGGFAIATLTPGGPAHVGGMVHVGDVITEVEGIPVDGDTTREELQTMLGGNDGSRVTITLQRGKKNFPHKITLTRSQSLSVSGEGEGEVGKRGSCASAVIAPHSLQPTSPRFMCRQESVVQPSQPSPRIGQQAHNWSRNAYPSPRRAQTENSIRADYSSPSSRGRGETVLGTSDSGGQQSGVRQVRALEARPAGIPALKLSGIVGGSGGEAGSEGGGASARSGVEKSVREETGRGNIALEARLEELERELARTQRDLKQEEKMRIGAERLAWKLDDAGDEREGGEVEGGGWSCALVAGLEARLQHAIMVGEKRGFTTESDRDKAHTDALARMTDDCVFIESQKAHAEQQVIDLKEENAKLVSELRGSKGLVASLSAALMIEGDSARETLLKDLKKSTERCASLEAMIHRDQEVISNLKGSLRRSEDAQRTIASSMMARLEGAEALVKEAKDEARRAEASRAALEAAVKEERTYAFLSNQVEASRREARELVAACEDAEAALSNNVEFEGCIRRRLENQIRVLQREIQALTRKGLNLESLHREDAASNSANLSSPEVLASSLRRERDALWLARAEAEDRAVLMMEQGQSTADSLRRTIIELQVDNAKLAAARIAPQGGETMGGGKGADAGDGGAQEQLERLAALMVQETTARANAEQQVMRLEKRLESETSKLRQVREEMLMMHNEREGRKTEQFKERYDQDDEDDEDDEEMASLKTELEIARECIRNEANSRTHLERLVEALRSDIARGASPKQADDTGDHTMEIKAKMAALQDKVTRLEGESTAARMGEAEAGEALQQVLSLQEETLGERDALLIERDALSGERDALSARVDALASQLVKLSGEKETLCEDRDALAGSLIQAEEKWRAMDKALEAAEFRATSAEVRALRAEQKWDVRKQDTVNAEMAAKLEEVQRQLEGARSRVRELEPVGGSDAMPSLAALAAQNDIEKLKQLLTAERDDKARLMLQVEEAQRRERERLGQEGGSQSDPSDSSQQLALLRDLSEVRAKQHAQMSQRVKHAEEERDKATGMVAELEARLREVRQQHPEYFTETPRTRAVAPKVEGGWGWRS